MQHILKTGRLTMRLTRAVNIRASALGPVSKSSLSGGASRPFKSSALNTNQSSSFPRLPNKPAERSVFRMFSSGGGGGGRSGGGGGGGGGGDGSGGLWGAYLALLRRNPLSTKAVTAALLNGLGDIIAQNVIEDGPFDFKRLAIFTFLGLALIGPALHFWYGSLSSMVTVAGTPGVLLRLALDQLCFAPVFISSIVASIMTLEGQGSSVKSKLKSDLPAIMKSNWALWVPFQFLNFKFVPVNLQVLAANVVALLWNTYMSWASHNSTATA